MTESASRAATATTGTVGSASPRECWPLTAPAATETATAGAARRQSREVKVARKRCGVTTAALSKQMTSTSALVVYVQGWVRWQ
ncbi:hypothetical protein PSN13_01622 [Micromonospora saelicesensis]|uniref:Uncharacterized protein n=1 Tax=Micromonospora saelicesensis TaxID=285676 RepID=A0A328NVU2_9ACTN|nr:hypothetical protein PSN13_01622 [Micromonospora saelicesensis]